MGLVVNVHLVTTETPNFVVPPVVLCAASCVARLIWACGGRRQDGEGKLSQLARKPELNPLQIWERNLHVIHLLKVCPLPLDLLPSKTQHAQIKRLLTQRPKVSLESYSFE
jgi:hypothetical protein